MFLVSRILMADWYSSKCALTWKLKGTKYSRLLFQLQPKTHRTEETDAGSLEFIPTPQATDYRDKTTSKSWQLKGGVNFSLGNPEIRALLPTPMVSDWRGSKVKRKSNSQLTETLGISSQLNPRFVAEMMGFPHNWTELPFLSGDKNPSKATATQ